MMSNTGYVLRAEDLVYLVQMRDKGMLMGISDPFQTLTDAERADAAAEAEETLADRGLLKMAFGGKSSIDEGLEALLAVCTEFDRYIGFDRRGEAGDAETKRYYNKGDVWATITDAEQEAFQLSYVSREQVRAEIDTFPEANFPETEVPELLLQRRELSRIVRHIRSGERSQAAAVLADYDFSKESGQLLLDALERKLPFLSLTLAAPTPEGLAMENAVVVSKDGKLAEFYQTVAEDDRTMIGLHSARQGVYVKLKEVAEQWSAASL